MKFRTFAAFVAGNLFAYLTAVVTVAVLDSIKAKEQQRQWSEERQRAQEHVENVPGFGTHAYWNGSSWMQAWKETQA